MTSKIMTDEEMALHVEEVVAHLLEPGVSLETVQNSLRFSAATTARVHEILQERLRKDLE